VTTRLTKAQRAALLARDARNRALRTFLQGLLLDVGIAVLLTANDALNGGKDTDYRLLGASLLKTAITAAISYMMRRFADPSKRIPTPLPPTDPGGEA
jgi:hypothetical protein